MICSSSLAPFASLKQQEAVNTANLTMYLQPSVWSIKALQNTTIFTFECVLYQIAVPVNKCLGTEAWRLVLSDIASCLNFDQEALVLLYIPIWNTYIHLFSIFTTRLNRISQWPIQLFPQ